MDSLLQDIRHAFRTLTRSRTYTAAAVLCLALGIGVNSAVFSLANATLFRPFPFEDPERVVTIHAGDPRRGISDAAFSAADYLDWTEHTTTLSATSALAENIFVVSDPGEDSERVEGVAITPNTFGLLGLRPALGRDFAVDEGKVGGAKVVILSHSLWQARYGGDPGAIGRTMYVDGSPHTIVGVMEPGMRFPQTAMLWVASQPDRSGARSNRRLWGIGRLAPGATAAQAQAELDAVAQRLAVEFPRTNAGWNVKVMPFQDFMVRGPLRLLVTSLLAAVGCVLLIACANVANLLLARATTRRLEMAVRAALGASRGRIARQLLTESVIVALAGGALGVLVAVWFTDAVVASIPEELPYWLRLELDRTVLVYTLAISVVTGLVFGLAPALRASRADLQHTLKDGRGLSPSGGHGLRAALVSGQIALSMVLLVGASLMIRSFLAVTHADAGFDTAPLLTARTYLTGDRYQPISARSALVMRSVERLGSLPGVTAVAATTAIPTDDGGISMPIDVEGQPRQVGQELIGAVIASTPQLFDVLGMAPVSGRTFTAQEAADSAAQVVMINRALAGQLWPGEDPVGRRLRLPLLDSLTWLTVIGVAPDVVYEEFGEESPESRRQVHVTYARLPRRYVSFIVRSDNPASMPASGIREAIRALDSTLPVFDVRTMDEVRRWTTWNYALYGRSFTLLGGIALLLAVVGIYGVMAYAVAQRTNEIGIRMALGADPWTVRRQVLGQGMRMVGVGLVVGAVAALAAGKAVSGLLYGVPPTDVVSFLVVPLALVTAALAACWIPARRATRVDPIKALRAG